MQSHLPLGKINKTNKFEYGKTNKVLNEKKEQLDSIFYQS